MANTILPRVSSPELVRYRPTEGLDGTSHVRLVHATPGGGDGNKPSRAKVERKGWVEAGISRRTARILGARGRLHDTKLGENGGFLGERVSESERGIRILKHLSAAKPPPLLDRLGPNLLLSVTGPAPAGSFWYMWALASPRGRAVQSDSP